MVNGPRLLPYWCENLQRKDLGRASEVKGIDDAMDASRRLAGRRRGDAASGRDDGNHIPPPTTPLPINAVALDTAAAEKMCHWYNEDDSINGWHQLHSHHSVDRDAVLAKARHKKRWPNGVPSQTTSQPINEAPIAVKEEKPRRRRRR